MSNRHLGLAWPVKASAIAKAVLISLADRADQGTGRCNPSHRDTAERTCLSEKSVSRGIDELERSGHITVDRSNGRHSTYLVHPKPRTDSPGLARQTTDSQSVVDALTTDSQSGVISGGTTDCQSATTDSQSGDPGLPVHEPRTDSPTNHQEPSVNHHEPPRRASAPACPHEEIIDIYHRVLPSLGRVMKLTPKRRTHLASRWKEEPERQSLKWWERLFNFIAMSPFLMGQRPGRDGGPPFELTIDFLIESEDNLMKIIEGRYHRYVA